MSKKKIIIISGSAGFIGNELLLFFLRKKYNVIGIDKHIYKDKKLLKKQNEFKNFTLIKLDLSKKNNNNIIINRIKKFTKNSEINSFWHLAANSNIPKGVKNKIIDHRDTFLSTVNAIQISKELKIKKLIFTSSSAVFGNIKKNITQSLKIFKPISNYGYYKLESEKILIKNLSSFNQILIFRLPNVIGKNVTHGIFFDLRRKIQRNKKILNILGDGSQSKPYMHIDDLIKIFIAIFDKNKKNLSINNIGPNKESTSVKFIAENFVKYNKINRKIIYEKKSIGWKGDVPKFKFSTNIEKKYNVKIKYSSDQAVIKTCKEISLKND